MTSSSDDDAASGLCVSTDDDDAMSGILHQAPTLLPSTSFEPSCAASMSPSSTARLEVTLEPATSIFRDEGGKFNYLCLFFVLRCGPGGPSPRLQALADTEGRLPLRCELVYEDGSPVPTRLGKPALQVLGGAGGKGKPEEAAASCGLESCAGSVRYRILKLSRNHDGKQFRLRVGIEGASEEDVAEAESRPTLVLSKRKWLRASERAHESEQRRKLEDLAVRQNEVLGKEAQAETACNNMNVHVRELAGMEALEEQYPTPVDIHMYASHHNHHGHRDEVSSGVNASTINGGNYKCGASVSQYSAHSSGEEEDEDPEYVPRAVTSRGRRVVARGLSNSSRSSSESGLMNQREAPVEVAPVAPQYDPQTNAILHEVHDKLRVLQRQIQRYNETVIDSARRIDALEEENRSLKRQLDEFYVLNDEPRMYKRTKPNPSPLITIAPLPLPRSHSLGLVNDDDGFVPTISDMDSIFGSTNF
mmetsp:Transcript_21417/g.42017  ORF Transcript_21417/g.42017 Transcript_21417/m.42017 type:complete len:476 (-) Transcript_21417:730-2157(-)|eukprot:CAMPEP_0171496824 /NCGR_PEP_ID=MMETSP0958-20121227/6921_1 /TAXON_ID=87120 /ORGANISM="Aurantiochytrium limacinum, Strain ATCCMYA-1381" /LENGTH=475 /DNA_ID=CAMNT_0012030979 /DNA_START=280 /DNA_END=1707 /DNA_ORIENTATION=+